VVSAALPLPLEVVVKVLRGLRRIVLPAPAPRSTIPFVMAMGCPRPILKVPAASWTTVPGAQDMIRLLIAVLSSLPPLGARGVELQIFQLAEGIPPRDTRPGSQS